MRWSVPAFGALVGVVALTGCSSTKVKDYRREANAICAAAEERLPKVPRPSSPAQVAEDAKREIVVRGDAIDQLSELAVPIEVEGATAVIEDLETRQERAHAVEKAAEAKDGEKLRELEEEESKEFELEAQHARAIGLRDCAGL